MLTYSSPFSASPFRAKGMRTKHGDMFTGSGPAASEDAIKKVNEQVKSWRLHRRTGHATGEIAKEINPAMRGWMQYYGKLAFCRSRRQGLRRRRV